MDDAPTMPPRKLSPGEKAELSRLLDELLDVPAIERSQWIDALPSALDTLKPHLRHISSLAPALDSAGFMDSLPPFALPHEASRDIEREPGRKVGPYQLVSELGIGGMGSVWLAVRSDGLINRTVALKLPHGIWRRADLPARWAREREILSSLNHPNIAHLYDTGIAEDGQPYLAIEHVEGLPIDEYCREHHLGIRERLKLIVQVARAVAYAHGKLIVHRDLKPANILVTAAGDVRLLDFGIAKLLEVEGPANAPLTEVSGRAFTPEYASPEQIRGEPLTVASDVYSLGVLLFELLTGTRPYRLKRESRGALEEAILQVEPKRPSEVAPEQLRKRIQGDLDTIVLKALKKDSRERYATADAFADDIERHLSSHPVLARPDSTAYRVGRFIRRNKVPVAAATIAVSSLLIGSGIVLWQSQAIRAEQRRTELARDFIADVFRQADPEGETGRVASAADLLRQAERRLTAQPDSDPRLHLELLDIIGESMFGLQQHEDSIRVLERAVALQESYAVEDAELSARLHLGLSRNYELLGRGAEAVAAVDRSLKTLIAARSTRTSLFAQAKVQQAAMGIVTGDYPLAEKAAQEAIAAATAAQGSKAAEIPAAQQQLSHVFTLTNRRPEALGAARKSFELLRELHAGDLVHPKLLEAAMYYAQSLHSTGDFDGASALYTQTVDRAIEVFGDNSRMVGELRAARASAETDRGNLALAVEDSRRALEIHLLQAEHGSAIQGNRARLLGTALLAARKVPEAVAQLTTAVELNDAAGSKLEASHSRLHLGLALAYLGKFEEATATLNKVLDPAAQTASRAQHLARRNMGVVLRMQGRYKEALPFLESAIEGASIQRSHRGDLAHALLEAGLVRLALGELDAAGALLVRSRDLFADAHGPRMTPARADLLLGLGQLSMAQSNFPGAVAPLEQAHEFWRNHDARSRWAVDTARTLAECYERLNRNADARKVLAGT